MRKRQGEALYEELVGRVTTGRGEGARFTGLDWARKQFIAELGVDPWPGTLNLQAEVGAATDWLRTLGPPLILQPPDSGACAADCWPVRIAGRFPAAVVRPQVSGYCGSTLEVIAALPLRTELALTDADTVALGSVRFADVDTVVFDVDGTLVDSVDGMWLAASRAAAIYGFDVPPDAVRRALNTGESLWQLIVPPEHRDDTEITQVLRRETMRHWSQVVRESVSVIAGVEQTLHGLRAAGIRLGIYTGSRGESFLPLERAGLMPLFSAVVTANDIGRPKPDPEGLYRCLERLGADAARAVYVGDSQHDIQCGRAAGARTVGVLSGAASSRLLASAGADRVFATVARLSDGLR